MNLSEKSIDELKIMFYDKVRAEEQFTKESAIQTNVLRAEIGEIATELNNRLIPKIEEPIVEVEPVP